MDELLKLVNFTVDFDVDDGKLFAVKNIGLDFYKDEIVGVVGESGSGKTQLFLGALGLLSVNGNVSGNAFFDGKDLVKLNRNQLDEIRGTEIAFIFQEALNALHPDRYIESQLCEILEHHYDMSRKDSLKRVLDMFDLVQLPHPKTCLKSYPHELSGGMRQRILIAMSLLCKPKLLIADEPTTALDVSIQAQILHLLKDIKKMFGMSIILITHDIGVVAGMAERIIVMYGGHIMESGTAEQVLFNPRHPYTMAILNAVPALWVRGEELKYIKGSPPDPRSKIIGCPFQDRCVFAGPKCQFVEFKNQIFKDFHFSACPFK